MLRDLIRWGAAALLVVSFAQPARALPLGGTEDSFTVSFAEVWEHLIGAILEPWEDSRGTCDPNGGIPCTDHNDGTAPLPDDES